MKSAIALTLLHNVRSFLAVEFSESEASRAIGSLSFAMFGKGSRKSKGKMPNCTPGKSWSCGYACLPMSKKNCGSPLPGQAKTYADYMAKQVQSNSKNTASSRPRIRSGKPPDTFYEDFDLDEDNYLAISSSNYKLSELTPLAGKKFSRPDVYGTNLEFSINGEYDAGDIQDKGTAVKAGLKALKEIRAKIQGYPEGTLVFNIPHMDDGLGDKRARLYKKSGFGDLDDDGYQWAIVRQGKLIPLSRQELEADLSG